MKKFITIIIAIAMILTMAACGIAEASTDEAAVESNNRIGIEEIDSEAIILAHENENVIGSTEGVYVCLHEEHGRDGKCVSCGKQVKHEFVNGVCACGRALDIKTEQLPKEWFAEQNEQGAVEKICYKADLYDNPGKTRMTFMSVYTPPQYNPDEQYNVLLFIDGNYSVDAGWLTGKEWTRKAGYVQAKNMFDYIMGQGLVEPCIIVTAFQDHSTAGSSPEQLAYEIRNYVLPHVAENYSTYMADSSAASQQAAREHLCIGGLSNYSMYMWRTAMMLCTDICANFISLSGTANVDATVEHMHQEELAGNGIRFFFMSVGTYEGRYNSDVHSFQKLLDGTELIEGENAWFCPVSGEHEWGVWYTSAYNALQLINW